MWSLSSYHYGDKETMDNIIISWLYEFQLFSMVMYRDSVHSDQHSHAHSSKIFIMVTTRFQLVLIIKTDTKSKNDGNCYCD